MGISAWKVNRLSMQAEMKALRPWPRRIGMGLLASLAFVILLLPDQGIDWLWFSLVYALIAVTVMEIYSGQDPIDLLNPLLMFLLVLYLYSVSSGIYVDANGVTYAGDVIEDEVRYRFYVACLIGAAAFGGGFVAARYHPAIGPHASAKMGDEVSKLFPVTCIALGILASLPYARDVLAYFNPLEVSGYAEWALESRLARFEDAAAGLRDVISYYLPVVLLLAGSTALALTEGPLLRRTAAAAVVVAYLATNTLAGKRGVVVDAAIPLVIFFHYRVRRIRLREFAAVLVCGYLFINLMSIARVSSDPLEMARLVMDAVASTGPRLLGIAATSELWTAMNLHRLIDGIASGETHFTFGASLISEWTTLIPRFLYPDRPLTLAEEFVNVFYPGLLESGGGMGLFILQEGYWALGMIGVAITMVGFGYLVATLYQLLLAYRDSAVAVLLYGFVYSPLVLSSVRGGITGSAKSAALAVVPMLLALLVSRLLASAGVAPQSGRS